MAKLTEIALIVRETLKFMLILLIQSTIQGTYALVHSWTWRHERDAENIVVIGGSFAGVELIRKLAHRLPTGCKLIWVEKNSHLNFTFNFPRFSVMEGREQDVFIPYDGAARGTPKGMLTRIQDTAVRLTATHIELGSGKMLEYSIIALATGSSQSRPVQAAATEKATACGELRDTQSIIKASHKIAIVGGGAVGVEIAGDIKDFYPDKHVTLIHSRGRLLNSFGGRLQDYVQAELENTLKVRVLLQQRPKLPESEGIARFAKLRFSDAWEEDFDAVIRCTGQRPNSSILASLYPDAISPNTGRVIVRPTLQVQSGGEQNVDIPVFALGDVADHGGPRMARAAWIQAGVVADNIMAMVKGRKSSAWAVYKPDLFFESSIKLTLGKSRSVTYARHASGSDVLLISTKEPLDMGIGKYWRHYGADINKPSSQ